MIYLARRWPAWFGRSLVRSLLLALVLIGSGVGARGAARPGEDVAAPPPARWSTAWRDGKAWLVTPCGERFFSIGVNAAAADPPLGARAGAAAGRAAASVDLLRRWGFNTLGAWSQPSLMPRMAGTIDLALGQRLDYFWLDPFDPRMAGRFRDMARRMVAPFRGKPWRIGYFSDNEIGWWNGPLFTTFSRYPPANHTKQELVALLRRSYGGSWAAFTVDFVPPPGVASFAGLLAAAEPTRLRAGGQGFAIVRQWTFLLAVRYYRLAHDAIRAADPEALILGDRLPIYYDPDAVRAMAPWVDVVSTNYNVDGAEGWIAHYYFDGLRALSGERPVLVSEWFFAAAENRSGNLNRTGVPRRPGTARPSHNINRTGHLMTVRTQDERARGAVAAAERLARQPGILGLHWFQHYDEPRGGRGDGEDYDFGLLDSTGRPYETLTRALAAIDPRLAAIHDAPPPARREDAIPLADIDPADNSLVDWPKEQAWVPLQAGPGEVPFGDVYLSWSARGLALATISMDYYAPDLLALAGAFPAGEAFRIDLGIEAGAGPRRFAIRVAPAPPRGDGKLRFSAQLCRLDGERCLAVPDAVVTYFGVALDQPRVILEALVPWPALGLAGPPAAGRVRVALAVTSFYRARWMSLDGAPPAALMRDPRQWRDLRLLPGPSAAR